jgi:ssDNA-binding Zn-finger/Zn-ribbon topoisomerase 1
MDETNIEGEPLPRYRLFQSDAQHLPIGDAVCESDNLDDLRVFRRNPGRRYVLYDRRSRIPPNNLDVDVFTDIKNASDKADGNGWYCNNPKCRMLIAAAAALPADGTLLRITCPHCHHPDHYFFSDYGWKRWTVR